ncbi:C40 family peptidase [Streptomyces olivoverticillatus]|nr:C40 family peptidase [Streptomyces olivoverticillatus]
MGAHKRPSMLSRVKTASALTIAAVGATMLVPGGVNDAEAASISIKALQVAISKAGSPYRWGATGPYSFDCSGLTLYSFKQVGKQLPRTAADQYNRTLHIPRSAREPGDLVFFHYGSYVYHVGIYAGDNQIWHAPKTGSVVRRERIWSGNAWYGRIDD